MSSSFEVLDVKNFLKARFINTSAEWIEACITFIKQENSGRNLSASSLKECVYNQWLSADLEEIGMSLLPQELPTIQKTTLNGSFALQVNFMRDVGKPAYAQLKDLNKLANANEEFSAAPQPSVPPWESKPTRMLMLNLTDGCTTVQGMEYKPINTLSLALPPGLKVLIQGPVDCRFGVFMLTPEKIRILGGEVESKLEQYSQQTLLREMLNLPELEETQTENENLTVSNVIPPITDEDFDDVVPTSENTGIAQHQTVSSSRSNRNEPINTSNDRTRQNIASRQITNRQNRQTTNSLRNYFNPQVSQSREEVDDFEIEDDDFAQSLNYEAIDELEKENTLSQIDTNKNAAEAENIWQEDEDVLRDMMAFQDEHPGFQFPEEIPDEAQSTSSPLQPGLQQNLPFTYLSSIQNQQFTGSHQITVKGFIIQILSKLECTVGEGWNLFVKINDGTATLDANIHDKVLESIIGVSAVDMLKLQKQAGQDKEKKREAMEAISKCKSTLQDYNCLMDIQFSSGCKPCIIKCHPVSQLQMKQLMERVRSRF